MQNSETPRKADALRPVKITPHFLAHPPGSCLIEMGNTRVICSAILEESVPPWLKGKGKGWLTAEYSMLPASSDQRIRRERTKLGGRTQEIQRLIGRSLRSSLNLEKLGERTFHIDCDVMDADGGTRTASITGGFVALVLAIQKLAPKISGLSEAIVTQVAAISVGMFQGKPHLDLDYRLDKDADVDMNIVKNSRGEYIEVQGTAENEAFDKTQLDTLLALADKGANELFALQQQTCQSS